MLAVTKSIFQSGNFIIASGTETTWRINIEELAFGDMQTLAALIAQRVPPFSDVLGVPTGGIAIAMALRPHITVGDGPLLLVDDVLTTGDSMRKMRPARPHIGYVIFDRSQGRRPAWIGALWTLADPECFKRIYYGGDEVVV